MSCGEGAGYEGEGDDVGLEEEEEGGDELYEFRRKGGSGGALFNLASVFNAGRRLQSGRRKRPRVEEERNADCSTVILLPTPSDSAVGALHLPVYNSWEAAMASDGATCESCPRP